jgi:hypothetical protein
MQIKKILMRIFKKLLYKDMKFMIKYIFVVNNILFFFSLSGKLRARGQLWRIGWNFYGWKLIWSTVCIGLISGSLGTRVEFFISITLYQNCHQKISHFVFSMFR